MQPTATALLIAGIALTFVSGAFAGAPTTINDFFLPGSQPHQSGNLETPDKCDNCHGGYDAAVEPAANWRGSMMAQAARDPLFFASMTIANQDAPESGDLCLRCHSPAGWLEGRSIPTDGSALNNNDREGVQCDFCHKLIKPTELGVNPYPDDPDYTAGTYGADQAYLAELTPIPSHSANGMYIASSENAKRGPFVDAAATHQMYYSPLHSDAATCGTCHDVSNPAFMKDENGKYVPNEFDQPASDFDPYTMFPVERTYSEWLVSDYNTPEGVYAPQFGGNKDTVHTCQDCHLKDVTGKGCNKNNAPVRDDLPLHDMTGGNTFVPLIIESAFPGETDAQALSSGIQRAIGMLQKAASMNLTVSEDGPGFEADVNIINETGHKLPSGYPEGRRMWINVKAYDSLWNIVYESGAYDTATGILTHDADVKIYEIKPGLTEGMASLLDLTPGPSFHFVINDTIYSDNRIPPRGFTNSEFESIQSPPVGYSYSDGQYWDNTLYNLPPSTARVISTLYYQTTSKEYVEFLRDENLTDDWGTILYDLWASNGKSMPVVMTADTVDLTPLPGNQPPAIDSIAPRTVAEGDSLSFDVTATDPNGSIPSLIAELLPANADFTDNSDGTGTFTFYPDFDQAGLFDIDLIASDGELADTAQVSITVTETNRPPLMDQLDNKAVNVGEVITFEVTAVDPDEDSLTMSSENLPAGASFVFDGWNDLLGKYAATFTWTPAASDTGSHDGIRFIATDGALTDADTISITVSSELYLCGNADGAGTVDIDDAVFLVGYVFTGGPEPTPYEAGDVDCSGAIDVDDIVYLIYFVFSGGPPPCDPNNDGVPDC